MITVKRAFQGYTIYRLPTGPIYVEIESDFKGSMFVTFTGPKYIGDQLIKAHGFSLTQAKPASVSEPEPQPPEPEPVKPEPPKPSLSGLTVSKLKDLAKSKGITGYSKMKKAALIAALEI